MTECTSYWRNSGSQPNSGSHRSNSGPLFDSVGTTVCQHAGDHYLARREPLFSWVRTTVHFGPPGTTIWLGGNHYLAGCGPLLILDRQEPLFSSVGPLFRWVRTTIHFGPPGTTIWLGGNHYLAGWGPLFGQPLSAPRANSTVFFFLCANRYLVRTTILQILRLLKFTSAVLYT